MLLYDMKTWRGAYDGGGAFLEPQLGKMDPTMHLPVLGITFSRDVPLRKDVSVADVVSMFTVTSFGAAGSANSPISWATDISNVNSGSDPNTGMETKPLHPWGMELKYSLIEMLRSQKLMQPIDLMRYKGIIQKHQFDTDRLCYLGDTTKSATYTGLLNCADVLNYMVPNGVSGKTQWIYKTPLEILSDFNKALTTTWDNAGEGAVYPNWALLPNAQFSYIANTPATIGGVAIGKSILTYLLENNIAQRNGSPLQIFPVKWAKGQGVVVGGVATDRMTVYRRDYDFVRFPMTDLLRTPVLPFGMYQISQFYGVMGEMERPYTFTQTYWDGI